MLQCGSGSTLFPLLLLLYLLFASLTSQVFEHTPTMHPEAKEGEEDES